MDSVYHLASDVQWAILYSTVLQLLFGEKIFQNWVLWDPQQKDSQRGTGAVWAEDKIANRGLAQGSLQTWAGQHTFLMKQERFGSDTGRISWLQHLERL